MVIPKEGIVTLRGTGLAVPSCKGPLTMVMNPTYAVLSRKELCHESRAHEGVAKIDDEGVGGVRIPPKNDDIIYEQPLQCNV